MRALLRRLILWALDGALPAPPPPPPYDPVTLDRIAAEGRN